MHSSRFRISAAVALSLLLLDCSFINTAQVPFLTSVPRNGTFIDQVPKKRFNRPTAISEERDVVEHRADGFGLVEIAAVDAYLNKIRTRLLAQSPISKMPGQVYLRADLLPGTDATPAGNVFLNLGLLDTIENESELAFVLAHELAHALLGHRTVEMDFELREQRIYLHYLQIARPLEQSSDALPEDSVEFRRWVEVVGATPLPLWNANKEEAADLFAIDLMHKAGYPPSAAVDWIRRKSDAPGWERDIAALLAPDQELLQPPDVGAQASDDLIERAGSTISSVGRRLRDLSADTQERLTPSLERKANDERRIANLSAYIEREYAQSSGMQPPNDWTSVKSDPERLEVVEAYQTARRSLDALAAGDQARAEELAGQAIKGRMGGHLLPRFAFFSVRAKQQEWEKAEANLVSALNGSNTPGLLAFRLESDLQLSREQPKQAISTLLQAYSRFERLELVLPSLIRAYDRAGLRDKENFARQSCLVHFRKYTFVCDPMG